MKKQVYRCITILTGAGISAESGIATFRDRDGLWCSHRIEDVACPGAYVKDPLLVHRFYDERRLNLLDASVKPNPAHMAIAHLQRAYKDGEVHLITQNVDDLHERGGSTSVLHMHGELLKMRCENTGLVVEMRRAFNPRADRCPCCDRLHTLRPHIVWFGEVPMHLDEIDAMLSKTDLFVAIGTSGNVYPAAGYAAEVRQRGAATLELNMTEGANQSMFDASRYGAASEVVPRWVDSVLDGTFCIKG